MKNTIILLITTLIISSVHLNIMAIYRYQTDTIHKAERYVFGRSIINSKWDMSNNNNGFVAGTKRYAHPYNKAFTMKSISIPALTYATKLRLLAQSNINRYVKNAFKAGININNDQEIYERSHWSKVRTIVDPMSLQRNFHGKFRESRPLTIWESN